VETCLITFLCGVSSKGRFRFALRVNETRLLWPSVIHNQDGLRGCITHTTTNQKMQMCLLSHPVISLKLNEKIFCSAAVSGSGSGHKEVFPGYSRLISNIIKNLQRLQQRCITVEFFKATNRTSAPVMKIRECFIYIWSLQSLSALYFSFCFVFYNCARFGAIKSSDRQIQDLDMSCVSLQGFLEVLWLSAASPHQFKRLLLSVHLIFSPPKCDVCFLTFSLFLSPEKLYHMVRIRGMCWEDKLLLILLLWWMFCLHDGLQGVLLRGSNRWSTLE